MNRYSAAAVFGHLRRLAVVSVALAAACGTAKGQAAAEYAGATSVSATTAAEKSVMIPAPSKPVVPKASRHLVIPTGPPPEVVNRKALEKTAGEDASKLLLRSTPSSVQVWVDGKFVGNTPMLLIVAPGKYQVEMRGQRLEPARQTVALLPRETREVVFKMPVRYPTTVSIH
ncbi:MAG: PEGA domain-containing protein [Candidatus Sulfotelmatobacter sp.]